MNNEHHSLNSKYFEGVVEALKLGFYQQRAVNHGYSVEFFFGAEKLLKISHRVSLFERTFFNAGRVFFVGLGSYVPPGGSRSDLLFFVHVENIFLEEQLLDRVLVL